MTATATTLAEAPTGAARTHSKVGLLVLPLVVVLAVFFLGSQVAFLREAFYQSSGFGQVDYSHATLSNVLAVFTDSFNRAVLLRTLWFSAVVVASCLLLGYPLAYVIARSRRAGAVLIVIVIASSFSGSVTLVLGWEVILGDTGPLNTVLQSLGLIHQPLKLINNMTGSIIGTVQIMLPFMVLTLSPAIQDIDVNLEHAAAGLGASSWRIWRTITLPLSARGAGAGSLLVFATTAGTFTTPALLGGGTTQLLPIVINQQIGVTLNYPVAAALALVLVIVVLSITYGTDTLTRRKVLA
jgi:putative spermidine/putrescine transport system permease protein